MYMPKSSVLDFLVVLITIRHMHYIKLHREARWLEGTRGSISKKPVLTMFKYIPAVLGFTRRALEWSSLMIGNLLTNSGPKLHPRGGFTGPVSLCPPRDI